MIFTGNKSIFEYNYLDNKTNIIKVFEEAFEKPAQFFIMNENQDCILIANNVQSIHYNLKTDELIDFDLALNIQELKCVTIDKDSDSFYILANKMESQLGFFLFKIKYDKPKKPKFKIIMKTKLDIGNCNMTISLSPSHGLKELIISYKSIYVNTF